MYSMVRKIIIACYMIFGMIGKGRNPSPRKIFSVCYFHSPSSRKHHFQWQGVKFLLFLLFPSFWPSYVLDIFLLFPILQGFFL